MEIIHNESREKLNTTCRVSISQEVKSKLNNTIYEGKSGDTFIDILIEVTNYPTMLRSTCPLNKHLIQLPTKIIKELSTLRIGQPFQIDIIKLNRGNIKILRVKAC